MKLLDVRYINPIDVNESVIAISDTPIVPANNNYDIVINVYDSFDNFLFRKSYKGTNFSFQFENESQYLQSLRNLIINEGLNQDGVYKFRYYFINDVFNSLFLNNNKFIVTEISSDRTEIRLNPFSKEDIFIENFNNFKQYFEIENQIVDVDKLIRESIQKNFDNFYEEDTVNIILDDLIFYEGGISIDLVTFLSPFYSNRQIENISEHIKESFLNTKDVVKSRIKKLVLDNEVIKTLTSSYKQTPDVNTLKRIEENIYFIFRRNIANIIVEEIVLLFDVDTEPTKGVDILISGCTDPKAINWNQRATQDDGSCRYDEPETGGPYPIYGCTDPLASNYDPDANTDNGTCEFEDDTPPSPPDDGDVIIFGCTDPDALNYNPEANRENGSCQYDETGGPLPVPSAKFGDVNSDGFIDDGDANLTLQGVVGNLQLTAYQRYLADVAEPYGKLNSADALAIAQKTGKTGQTALNEDEFNNQ